MTSLAGRASPLPRAVEAGGPAFDAAGSASGAGAAPSKESWIAAAAAALAGAASFFLLVGAGPLDSADAVWSNPPGDMGQMLAGFEALLREPWGFPPTVSSLLVRPIPVSIVFTDSIPWLALAMKAAGPLAGAVNPLALFLLLSHVLQAVAAAVLLRACGVRSAALSAAGVLLVLTLPAWIYRQMGHPALAGHWIVLFALALAVAAARKGLGRGVSAGFAALGAVAAGVHAYHVVPVSACCAAALGSELLQRRPGAWRRVAGTGAAFAAAVGGAAALLGYGIGGGPSHGGSVLGLLSMNLAGPFLPQASSLFGHRWTGWTSFTGTVDPTGWQYFEGFNYLGGGVLLLVAAAGVLAAARAARGPAAAGSAALLRRYGPLGAALLALALLAVGPKVYFGERLLVELPRPDGVLGDALGYVRAHGRFFWAPAYALLAASLVALDRWLPRRAAVGLCAAALALQIYDTRVLREAVAGTFAGPDPMHFPSALADAPATAGRNWLFLPTLHCAPDPLDQEVIRQLSLVAIRRGGSSNSAPTARNPIADCEEPVRQALRGEPGPAEAAVLLRRSFASDGLLAAIAARRGPCYAIERGALCGRGLESIAGLPRFEPADLLPRLATWHEPVPLAGPAARTGLFGEGWSTPEPSFRWSDGGEATLVFVPPAGANMAMRLEAVGHASRMAGGGQRVAVSVNGEPAAEWLVGAGDWAAYDLPLPATAGDRPLFVRFSFPDAVSPREMGRGSDARRLGIAVRQVSFRRLDAP